MKNLKSKCCGAELITSTAEEGTSCYVCTACQKPTDPATTKKRSVLWTVSREDEARQKENDAHYKIGVLTGIVLGAMLVAVFTLLGELILNLI